MQTPSLAELIQKLSQSPRVKGIFTTGTTATGLTPSSDIDLIVILDRNVEEIKSVYTMIDHRFSDIFFFDVDFIKKLHDQKEISANNFEGIFLEWLTKGKIEYDTENILTNFKRQLLDSPRTVQVAPIEQTDFWFKINYNFIANTRYFQSSDPIYHQALEMRLLYSVSELFNAYFSFRAIPWRGEKMAVKHLQEHAPEFSAQFEQYLQSQNLTERMRHYTKLFQLCGTNTFQPWKEDFIVTISNKKGYDEGLIPFWKSLKENHQVNA